MEIGDILDIAADAEFESAALRLFARQAAACPPYCEYISRVGFDPAAVGTLNDIPFMPVELFGSHRVYCGGGEPEIVFTSSGTGGGAASKHHVARRADYERTFARAFELFYGNPAETAIYALLPGYLEREGSSLIYMIDKLIAASGRGGFYLHDHDRLIADMQADRGRKILFGVSYALLDLAERHAVPLHDTVVMETGGMKGRREEIAKEEFHEILCRAFGVDAVHSEFGMAELSSQAYSGGGNLFRTPPWMRVAIRDLNDPFELLAAGRSGGVNIIDLANIGSCAFIQTQDVGIAFPSDGVETYGTGSYMGGCANRGGYFSRQFSILGRADRSEIRGCNLLVQ